MINLGLSERINYKIDPKLKSMDAHWPSIIEDLIGPALLSAVSHYTKCNEHTVSVYVNYSPDPVAPFSVIVAVDEGRDGGFSVLCSLHEVRRVNWNKVTAISAAVSTVAALTTGIVAIIASIACIAN